MQTGLKLNPIWQAASISPRRIVIILGVPVDALGMEETLERIDGFIQTGRRTGRVHQVVTVNTDFIVNAIKDPEIRYILQDCDLATSDGMPVVWAANYLGFDLDKRVTGADMVPQLAKRAAERGYSIYFLGAAPGVAQKAVEILKADNPDLIVAGIHSPPVKPLLEMDPAIIADIKKAKPDILLVAFGNPKQEKWIAMHRYELGAPVMMGIGGTLDFIAGATTRAPAWMQNSGIEWLHRLWHNPARLWRRYVSDFLVFGSFFFRQLWIMKRSGPLPVTLPTTEEVVINEIGLLRVSGTLSIQNQDALFEKAMRLCALTSKLTIDLSRVIFLDSAATGMLVHLTKELRSSGGELYLVSVPEAIRHTFKFLHLEEFFNIKKSAEEVLYGQTDSNGAPSRSPEPPDNHTTMIDGQAWKVVRLPLRLDAATADQIRQECIPILEASTNLLLDCSAMILLASAGLAVIADLYKRGQNFNAKIMLTNANKDAVRVLHMVKFDKFLDIK